MGTMQDGRGVWTDLCLVGNGAGPLVWLMAPDSMDVEGHSVCGLLTGPQGCCETVDEG